MLENPGKDTSTSSCPSVRSASGPSPSSTARTKSSSTTPNSSATSTRSRSAIAKGDKQSFADAKTLINAFDGKVKTALDKAKGDAKNKVGSAEFGPRHAFRLNVATMYIGRITAVDQAKGDELQTELDKVSTLPIHPKAAQSTYKKPGEPPR